ncbi:universal stress protein [Sedimenticola hydrogenitrophicus]|uniref:universal stress protein n=1 Tax=Sedimenticola hydrogenitrophicus TaxID=2967975 RepID=UPI0021A6FF3A|nr:universal stress protein [Sedimenticola hydrogenitrophicus]
MTTKPSVGYHSIVALYSPTASEQTAVLRAANVASKLHSQVTLVHVVPAGSAVEAEAATMDRLLAENAEIAAAKSTHGDLLQLAPQANAVNGDLVVLDNVGFAQLQPLLQADDEAIPEQTECDVLVVHANRPPVDYRHIVVAADLDDQGLMTIYKAVRMAKRYNARLTLLNVVDNFTAGKDEENAAKNLRMRGLEAFTSVIEGLEVEQEVVVTTGPVDQMVSNYSARQQAGLIVIGSYKLQGLHILLGTTAKRVIETANCDVLVVHE